MRLPKWAPGQLRIPDQAEGEAGTHPECTVLVAIAGGVVGDGLADVFHGLIHDFIVFFPKFRCQNLFQHFIQVLPGLHKCVLAQFADERGIESKVMGLHNAP